MDPTDLLILVAGELQTLGLRYLATGSIASTLYGEARFTNDIDIALEVNDTSVRALCDAFEQPDFYVSQDAAAEAVRTISQFNVIHPISGLKVDFMVAGSDAFNRSRFARVRRIEIRPGMVVSFASPEDVILRKLQYYKSGGSEKHLGDIQGMLRVTGDELDRTYLHEWARILGVEREWSDMESRS